MLLFSDVRSYDGPTIRRRAPKTMSLRLLTDSMAQDWRAQGNILYPNEESLKHDRWLDQSDLDCLGAEAAWRTGASRRVVLPSMLVNLLLLATTDADMNLARTQMKDYASRADVLLVPIVQAKHWVLLVLECAEQSTEFKDRRAFHEPAIDIE